MAQVGEVSSPDAGPSFRISAASAARWGFISFAGEQFLRLALTVPLARVLGPDNWGILAQAAIYISFTSLFIDQGFGAALIQKKTVVPRDLGSAFWLNIGSATLLAAITVPLAPLVANFFHTPELTSVLLVLSLAFILRGLGVVPRALLTRDLKMRTLAFVQIGSALVAGAIAICAALVAR